MKITIGPDAEQAKLSTAFMPPTITVEFPGDRVVDIVERFKGLLIAYGFNPDTVNEYFPEQ